MAVRNDWTDGEVLYANDLNDTIDFIDNSESLFSLMGVMKDTLYTKNGLLKETINKDINTVVVNEIPKFDLKSIDASINEVKTHAIISGTNKVRLFCSKSDGKGILVDVDIKQNTYDIIINNVPLEINHSIANYNSADGIICSVSGDNYLIGGFGRHSTGNGYAFIVQKRAKLDNSEIDTKSHEYMYAQNPGGGGYNYSKTYQVYGASLENFRILVTMNRYTGSKNQEVARVLGITDFNISQVKEPITQISDSLGITIRQTVSLADGRVAFSLDWGNYGSSYNDYHTVGVLSDGTNTFTSYSSQTTKIPAGVVNMGNYGLFGVRTGSSQGKMGFLHKNGTYSEVTINTQPGMFGTSNTAIAYKNSNEDRYRFDGEVYELITDIDLSKVTERQSYEDTIYTSLGDVLFRIEDTEIWNLNEVYVESSNLDIDINVDRIAVIDTSVNSEIVKTTNKPTPKIFVKTEDSDSVTTLIESNKWELFNETKNLKKIKFISKSRGGANLNINTLLINYK